MIKIIKHYYVSESVYNWVRGLANWDEQTQGTYDLFVSLMTRSAWRYRSKGEVTDKIMYPLHSSGLRKIGANLKNIDNLIECDNHYIPKYIDGIGKSRYYWINAKILKAFEALIFTPGKHCINLYTGKKARKNRALPTDVPRSSLYDKSRNLITSQLVADAINIISKKRITINLAECKKYTDRLNDGFAKYYPGYTISNPTLKGRLVKNTRNANFLFSHLYKFRDQNNFDIANYQPSFKPTMSGRTSERSLGLQGCSRTMRRKLLKGIECVNFDMQNSQLTCLHYLLPPGEVKDNLAKKISRLYSEAAAFGLPKKLVKPYIYSLVFNRGVLHDNLRAVRTIKKYCRAKRLLTNLADFTAGLAPIIEATKLLLSIVKEKYSHGSWINHAGVILTSEALEEIAEKKLLQYLRKGRRHTLLGFDTYSYKSKAKDKTLLAFYLQGIETYVIHKLTVECDSPECNIISNQHDGLIIMGDKNIIYEQIAKINKAINANFVFIEKPL